MHRSSQILLGHLLLSVQLTQDRRPTSGLEPLTYSLRVISQVLQGIAEGCKTRISRRLSLLRFAACCTVLRSRWYQSGVNRSIAASQSCSLAHASEVRPAPRRHTSIKSALDHYSHWMPSMGRDTADGMNEALGWRPALAHSFSSVVAQVHAATARRGRAAASPLPRSLRRRSTHSGLPLRLHLYSRCEPCGSCQVGCFAPIGGNARR
jgi:hypothetical protein